MFQLRMTFATGLLAIGLVGCTPAAGDSADAPAAATAPQPASANDNGLPPPPEIPTPIEPGNEYSATTILDCGFAGAAPNQKCNAGVKRNWGDKGDEALVEVFKPDGMKRAIYFRGTDPYGADGSQADGSAGWDFTFARKGDEVTITYGPETYVIFDALIVGG